MLPPDQTIFKNTEFAQIAEDLFDLCAKDAQDDCLILSIKLTEMVWKPFVTNILGAPSGMAVNAPRDHNLPMGYPGWTGRMNVLYEGSLRPWYTNLRRFGIFASEGFGYSHFWSAEFCMFSDDWQHLLVMEYWKGNTVDYREF